MPKRIELRGIIVGPEYDASWAESWIKRGVITPESRIRQQIAEASGQDIDLYINSPGGSVFDGNEILNALKTHRATGAGLTVTVGALAASMAADIVVCCGAPVKAFKNSKLMFHGSTTITWAGKQAHEDTAALLGKINADAADVLTGKFGVPKDTVDAWMAEGRMGWLTAEEAKGYGIVSEIIDAQDTAIKITRAEADSIREQGLDVAACGEILTEEQAAPDAAALVDAINMKTDELAAETARTAAAQADVDRLTQALELSAAAATAAQNALAEAKARASDFQSRFDKLSAEHAKTQAELSAAKTELGTASAKNKELSDRLLRVAAQTFGRASDKTAVCSIDEAVKLCGGDTVLAKQKHPEVFEEYRRSRSGKK